MFSRCGTFFVEKGEVYLLSNLLGYCCHKNEVFLLFTDLKPSDHSNYGNKDEHDS